MQKNINQQTSYFTFKSLSIFPNIKHFISTREGGVSQEAFEGLNLGLHVLDDTNTVVENRKKLANSLESPLEYFVYANQTHSENVVVLSQKDQGRGTVNYEDAIPNTDALVTNQKNIFLSILTADCVPLLFYDTKKQVIGAVHAGWKGTVKKIGLKTLHKMMDEFGSQPNDILVGIAPHIQVHNYEVGEEVVQAIEEAFETKEKYLFWNEASQRYHLDLSYANKQPLIEAGIPLENIEVSDHCVFDNPDLFYSSRYGKGKTGRFATGIMLLG